MVVFMKIDYSFPNTFFNFIRENSKLEEFMSHPFSEFFLKKNCCNAENIQEFIKNTDFQKFLNKENKINKILEELIFHENLWAHDLKKHMELLFPEHDMENTELFFILGKEPESKNGVFIDIGEYINNNSYQEIIPEIIYKSTLFLYTRKHPYKIDLKHLNPVHYMDFIHYLIHYKGAAAYSARLYMNSSSFDYSNSYFLKSSISLDELLDSYNSLSKTFEKTEEVDLFHFLETNSFPENLGYQIFRRTILSGNSFYEVVSKVFPDFINMYLPPILPQNMHNLSRGNLSENSAREISDWKYPGEYSIYNFPSWNEMSKLRWAITFKEKREKEFMGFFIQNSLIGFGQVVKGAGEIAIGVGIRPDLCGYGYGTRIVGILIDECKKINSNWTISLKVRSFNKRAINCYKKLGFQEISKYKTYSLAGEEEFIKMELYPTH